MAKHFIEHPCSSVDDLMEKVILKRRARSSYSYTLDNIPFAVLQENAPRILQLHNYWAGNKAIVLLQMSLESDPTHPSGQGMSGDKLRGYMQLLSMCNEQLNYCDLAGDRVQAALLNKRRKLSGFATRSSIISEKENERENKETDT